MNYRCNPPQKLDEQAKVVRARLFEAIMHGGTTAYNTEWDRLFAGPRLNRRIDAHDVGDVLWLAYPIPESNVNCGFYVLERVLGEDAYLFMLGEDEAGDLVGIQPEVIVHREKLDWFQYMGIALNLIEETVL